MNNPFEIETHKSKYEVIYDDLKKKIQHNEINAGEKLPTEKELLEHYNVSRITTKKALDMLAGDGMIERIPGKGTFVKAKNASHEYSERSKSLMVGYISPDFDDDHGLELLSKLEEFANERSVNIVVKRTYGSLEREKTAIISLINQGIDGLIILPVSGEYYNEEIVKLNLQNFPHVLVDRYLKGFATTSIRTDNKTVTKNAVEYLFELNHEKIALCTPPYKDTSAIEDRVEGFIQAYAERGILVDKNSWITNLESTLSFPTSSAALVEKDIDRIIQHLKTHPEITAVFAMEYKIAVLVNEAAKRMNDNVPEDLSIICFDTPKYYLGRNVFTHIKQNTDEMAENAINSIIALVNEQEHPIKTSFEAELIDRGTVMDRNDI